MAASQPEGRSHEALGTAPLVYTSSKAALDRLCGVVTPQLKPLGVAIMNMHPGGVHIELAGVLAG
jgi:NAD(P)-dependent dehydrogenase (short-subunit alcohol dehydrogenase family)